MTERVSQEPPRSVKRALMRRHSKAMRFALDADELDANLREAERLAEEDWQFALQAALPALEADLRERLAQVRAALREAVDAGETLASFTTGHSESRTVAEAKEAVERARATLDAAFPPSPKEER